ncbi:MAG: hypothetical protein CL579_10485 [Alteromonadaceae bacterium]|nr:hypothetical protein [Alteromonadaceae bacterium]
MARLRKGRSQKEWLECGQSLIEFVGNSGLKVAKRKSELKNEIDRLLKELHQAKANNEQEKMGHVVSALNKLSNDCGDAWKSWVKKIAQDELDKKRDRTDLSLEAARYFESLIADSSKAKTYEQLHQALKLLGVTSLSQLDTLYRFLSQFEDSTEKQANTTSLPEQKIKLKGMRALRLLERGLKSRDVNSLEKLTHWANDVDTVYVTGSMEPISDSEVLSKSQCEPVLDGVTKIVVKE